MQFSELSLTAPLQQAVAEAGYTEPSPIQKKAIPPVLAGRDLLGCAQTGTGKTAAFALPILQLLAGRAAPQPAQPAKKGRGGRPVRALVLTPTRELALQIQESFVAYGRHLPLRAAVIFGGVGQAPQVAALQRGVDILVATPGRLNDLIGQGYVHLGQLEIFVLDEADRMLDMGFIHDVKKVLKQLPEKRQTLLFSATMPPEIAKLAATMLHEPAKVFVTPPATTVEKIEQSLYRVDKGNKRHLLAYLLQDERIVSALVFTRTKHGADRVVRELKKDGIPAMAIHGNKSQNARQDALARFKDGRVRVLVATDIAARGLDINELSHVINYDLPNIPETYVHRIGRTGRAGHAGVAISFAMAEELPYLADIEKLIGFRVPEQKDHPWPMQEGPQAPEPAAREKSGQQPKSNRAGGRPAPAAQGPAPRQGSAPAKGARADGRENPQPQKGRQPARQPQAPQAPATPPQGGGQAGPRRGPAKPPAPGRGRGGGSRPSPIDPYSNRTGGQAIITKRPPWSTAAAPPPPTTPQEGEHDDMARNNRRRNRGKNRGNQPEGSHQKAAPPKPGPGAVFDFSEAELAEDDSIQIISRGNGESKYTSFEDYLKDH